MKIQKIAVFVGSLFLLTSLVLPALVSAQVATQSATVTLTGAKDIFYEGYSNPMQDLSYTSLTTSSSDQSTVADYAGMADWTAYEFIGVIDLETDTTAWNLQVQGPSQLTDGAKILDLTPDQMYFETTANKWTALTLTDSASMSYPMTKASTGVDTDDVWYWESTGYTWTDGDLSAPLNNTSGTDFTDPLVYDDAIVSTAATILTKPLGVDFDGIGGIARTSRLDVYGGTPAGNYSGLITYTLI